MATIVGVVEAVLGADIRGFQTGMKQAVRELKEVEVEARRAADAAKEVSSGYRSLETDARKSLPALSETQRRMEEIYQRALKTAEGLEETGEVAVSSFDDMVVGAGLAVTAVGFLVGALIQLARHEKEAAEAAKAARAEHLKAIEEIAAATEFATRSQAQTAHDVAAQQVSELSRRRAQIQEELQAIAAARAEAERELLAGLSPAIGRSDPNIQRLLASANAEAADKSKALREELEQLDIRLATFKGSTVAAGQAVLTLTEEERKLAAQQEKVVRTARLNAQEQQFLATVVGKTKSEIELVRAEFDRLRAIVALSTEADEAHRVTLEKYINVSFAARRAALERAAAEERFTKRVKSSILAVSDWMEIIGDMRLMQARFNEAGGLADIDRLGGDVLVRDIQPVLAATKQLLHTTENRLKAERQISTEQKRQHAETQALVSAMDTFASGLALASDNAAALVTLFGRVVEQIRKAADESQRIGGIKGAALGGLSGLGIGLGSQDPLTGLLGGALGGLGATGGHPLGAIVGGLAGVVGGLVSMGSKAKEEAARFAVAQREWERALESFGSLFDDVTTFEQARQNLESQFKQLVEGAFAAFGRTDQLRGTISVENTERFIQHLLARGEGNAKAFAAALQELVDAFKENEEQLKQQHAEAKVRFEEDQRVRLLLAQGREEEAEAMRRQLEAQRQVAEVLREWGEQAAIIERHILALEDQRRAEEEAAEAARKAAEEQEKLAQAQRDAAEAAAQAAQALKDTTDNAFRGLIDEAVRLGLMDPQEGFARGLAFDREAFLRQFGDTGPPEWLLRLFDDIQRARIDEFLANKQATEAEEVAQAVTGANARTEDILKGAQAITETQAIRQLHLLESIRIHAAGIEMNTRPLRGDGVGVFPNISAAPVRSGPAVNLTIHVQGSVIGPGAGRRLAQEIWPELDEIFGGDSARRDMLTGVNQVR